MRIVVIETDGQGGMLHFSHMLSEGLSREGHEVTLYTATDYELTDVDRSFEVRPVFSLWARVEAGNAHTRGFLRSLYVRFVRRAIRATRLFWEMVRSARHIDARSPDLVLVRPFPLPGHDFVLRRLKRSGAALIEVTHEFEPRDTARGPVAWLERSLYTASSEIVDARLFMGERIMRDYAERHPGYREDRMFLIPHGDGELFLLLDDPSVDIDAKYDLNPDDRIALLFGNLRATKGAETLVRAFAAAKRPEGSKLVVVGHPARNFDTNRLPQLAEELEIADESRFDFSYLPMAEVAPLFRRARLLALPYSTATQSGPLHIAMSFGLPVVAMKTGGLADVVDDEVNGLMVEPGDVPGMSRAIGRLLSDDRLEDSLRAGMRARAGLHSWDAVAQSVVAAYERTIAMDR